MAKLAEARKHSARGGDAAIGHANAMPFDSSQKYFVFGTVTYPAWATTK